MFADPAPRVFGLPPGVDFAAEVARGLRARLAGAAPERMARVRLLVPTARMRAALTEAMVDLGPGYLPRIQTLAELAEEPEEPGPDLDRILQTARLVRALLASGAGLAPAQAALGLARGLVALADEMAEEGVPAAALAGLDVADHAAHWQTALRFLGLVAPWIDGTAEGGPGRRLRLAVEGQIARWAEVPPGDPVLVVGSTGSRRSTADLLAAVAGLPQGAVILPGFDADLPQDIRERLVQPGAADHPQARLAQVLHRLGNPAVQPWTAAPAPDPARNRLLSLALRPAPATDQWRVEGADLDPAALDQVTILTAPGPRAEALAIARALAEARAQGRSAALVTPDRALARRVTAALDRWRLVPDDSAGRPLGQSAPARLLRLIARRIAGERGAVPLMALLKHPLVHTGAGRGDHLLALRSFELWLRREGRPFPEAPDLRAFAERQTDAAVWAEWLGGWLAGLPGPEAPLADAIIALPGAAMRLAAGAGAAESAELWAEAAGERVRAALDGLVAAVPALGADMPLSDLPALVDLALAGEVRDPVAADPLVMIWGPQEVRGRRADLVVLGGLAEGTWPAAPAPDPWLSRNLRLQAGLRLPERDVGLAAHDFQIAAAAPQVVLSLPLRSAEAESVPARWLNRLTNLAAGLPALAPGLDGAKDRGAALLARALAEEADVSAVPLDCARPNPRPAPAPPVALRPTELRVTEVATLIRNPYAVYARQVLRLNPLEPLGPEPDARQRGVMVHRILESFVDLHPPGRRVDEADFLAHARDRLAAELPWPAERVLWLARLARLAPDFLDWHAECDGAPALVEGRGALELPGLLLVGRPDRIDRLDDGRLRLWDYKTGTPPTDRQQRAFDKQLILLALMAVEGAFKALGRAEVEGAAYVGLGSEFRLVEAPTDPDTLTEHREKLLALMARYRQRTQGYVARRALQNDSDRSDYDALSRLGEWRVSDRAVTLRVGDDDG